MQSKHDLERHYEKPDPWGYKKREDDSRRKHYLISIASMLCPLEFGNYKRAIDICCGEGWITGSLPAGDEIHGIELSDNAASRFPPHVKRVAEPEGKYDLVVATGCLYAHYDWQQIVRHIIKASAQYSIIILSNIEPWEHAEAVKRIPGKQIFEARFPYNEHHQKVRAFLV